MFPLTRVGVRRRRCSRSSNVRNEMVPRLIDSLVRRGAPYIQVSFDSVWSVAAPGCTPDPDATVMKGTPAPNFHTSTCHFGGDRPCTSVDPPLAAPPHGSFVSMCKRSAVARGRSSTADDCAHPSASSLPLREAIADRSTCLWNVRPRCRRFSHGPAWFSRFLVGPSACPRSLTPLAAPPARLGS